jgi:aminotransferase in exopolysaccharide biosynthesis
MFNINRFIEFVRDTYKTDQFIPLHEPRFYGNERKYVLDAIDSTFVSSVGIYVDKFEEKLQQFSNTEKAVAVVNGTSALQVALRVSGVKSGDEVLTQALTFVATANAISYNGAKPVFIDVDLETMGLSPFAVQQFLETNAEIRNGVCYNTISGNRISACVPMHTFGFPVHLAELMEVCNRWNIPIVEDAAESIGSLYHDKPTGSFGLCGVYSFNGNKVITAGGGGAIVSKDLDIAISAKHLTTTAKVPHAYEYVHNQIGYNYRMPNLNAALVLAQLEQLGRFIEQKRELASSYKSLFDQMDVHFRTEMDKTKAAFKLGIR